MTFHTSLRDTAAASREPASEPCPEVPAQDPPAPGASVRPDALGRRSARSGATMRWLRRGLLRTRLGQVAIIVALWLLGEALVRLMGLPVPGGIVGLAFALALLLSRRVKAVSMRRGAQVFLADMLLFFVPAVLAVVDHREFVSLLGLKILLVILAGTAAVMGVTALTVDLCYRWRLGHGRAE